MSSQRPRPKVLVGSLVAQAVLVIAPLPVIPAMFLTAIVIALCFGGTIRGVLRWNRGLLILMIAVLAFRLLGSTAPSVIWSWGDYAIRLITAMTITYALYSAIGSQGILATLLYFFTFLPTGAIREFLEDTSRSFVLFLPILHQSLRQVKEATRVRPIGRRGYVRRILVIYITTVADIPRARAEAILVRGLR